MKRAFRVATVFTGAAACAAALAPTAQAAAVAPGARAAITPDNVTVAACPLAIPSGTLVLAYTSSEFPHPDVCFRGSGTWYVGADTRFSAYVGVSKSGSLLIDGRWEKFTAGYHHLYKQVVTSVYLKAG
jgi:hypothetical protein